VLSLTMIFSENRTTAPVLRNYYCRVLRMSLNGIIFQKLLEGHKMYGRKFMEIGAALQWASKTPEEARTQLKKSCQLCSEKYGIRWNCTKCPIEYAHETVMKEIFGIDITKEEKA